MSHRFQFNLRKLFLLTTVSAVLLGIGVALGLNAVLQIGVYVGLLLTGGTLFCAIAFLAMLVVIYTPKQPFQREQRRDPPPHTRFPL
mgnify:CR=1 FL=1